MIFKYNEEKMKKKSLSMGIKTEGGNFSSTQIRFFSVTRKEIFSIFILKYDKA